MNNVVKEIIGEPWVVQFADGPSIIVYSKSKSRDKIMMEARKQLEQSLSFDMRQASRGRITQVYKMRPR